jgi:DNA methyltransferase 1-associated protein 1
MHCIHRTDPPTQASSGISATKAAHTPVFLRSYKLPTVRAAVQPRVTQVLTELGLRTDRLVMPTQENVQQLELLLNAASALVETRKVVERVEQEIRVVKERLALKEGTAGGDEEGDGDGGDEEKNEGEGDAEGSEDDDAEGEDADADADGETDRAASLAPSARSAGRKRVSQLLLRSRFDISDTFFNQNKRSMSISSMGSTATTATRAQSRKRHRS